MNREAGPATIWGAISRQAQRDPDACAIRTAAGCWSYGDFCNGAERVAAGLVALGLSRGDRLLLLAVNGEKTCMVWLACHRLGVTACFVSRRATLRELSHAITVVEPKAIVGEASQLALASQALTSIGDAGRAQLVSFVDDGGSVSVDDLLATSSVAIGEPRPDDAAEVLFTSGTTSAPKAVMATTGALLEHWSAVSEHYRMGPSDVGYMVTPIHHQSALRHVGLITWLGGGEVVVADGFHPRQVWADVNRHAVTYTCMLDAMFRILFSLPVSAQERGHRLRLVIGLGDHALAEQCERRYGFEVAEVYGSTETGAPVTANLGMDPAEHARYRHAIPGARFCGWPLPGNQAWIVHPDGEGPGGGDGVIGEIVVRSTVSYGRYLNGAVYGDGSGDPRDVGFHSSDRGLIGPDGALYFAGRSQEIIRRAGENISALEIEAVMNEHPGIVDVAVIGVPDPVRQEEVKAFVVAAEDDLEPAELRSWLHGQLSPHKLPRYIAICEGLPMTESGKIGKAALARGEVAVTRTYDAVAEAGNPTQ